VNGRVSDVDGWSWTSLGGELVCDLDQRADDMLVQWSGQSLAEAAQSCCLSATHHRSLINLQRTTQSAADDMLVQWSGQSLAEATQSCRLSTTHHRSLINLRRTTQSGAVFAADELN